MIIQSRREGSFLFRVSKIIEANLQDEDFGVSQLAIKMNMSRSNLHRRIKSATGISVSQYIRNTKVKKST
jgi:AraC-like DNA-binding protein